MMKQRVGIIGSGFIGKGLVNALHLFNDIEVTKVLTRSRVDTRGDYRYPDYPTDPKMHGT